MAKKDTVVYLMENEEIDRELLKEIIEHKGFSLHNMRDINDVLHFIRKFDQQDSDHYEPKEYGKAQILKQNIPTEEALDFFSQLAHLSRWIITILDQMSIGISIIRDNKYVMTSQWLPDRIGYPPSDMANLKAGDTFIEEDRKKFRRRMALLKQGTISWIESDFHLVSKNKTILDFYSFSFLVKINDTSYTLTYNTNKNNSLWKKTGSGYLISLIVHEMHQKMSQLITILCDDSLKSNSPKALNHGNYKEFNLTKREFDILELICSGKTNQEIAQNLFISRRTAEAHRARILLKTDSRNTAELVRFAIRNHLILP
jgi:DNA-binding CsgD family transcriptional regulator